MNRNSSFKQQGVALILSLLLLFVLVILGVAGFNSTHVQERSAGNIRLQTVAFEAASAGANNAINFFDAHRDDGDVPDQNCGATGHIGWVDGANAPILTSWQPDSDYSADVGGLGSATVTLSQRMYCLADAYPCSVADEAAGLCTPNERPPRSQLFVLNRGEVEIDGNVVAQRDVEVRLEVGNPGGGVGDGCGALCLPGCDINSLAFPTSESFQIVGGNAGNDPAITASCETAQNQIIDAIEAIPGNGKKTGNYVGGVAATEMGAPWSEITTVEEFRANLQATANVTLTGPVTDTIGNTTYGTTSPFAPQITYINGDASFGGGISGAGILVVDGNLSWQGTPNFDGLILVLGGTFAVTGGGKGGNNDGKNGVIREGGGSVVVLNTQNGDLGAVNLDFTGGGNGLYQFSCESLWMAWNLLSSGEGGGQSMWSPQCDVGPATVFQAGPPEIVIASWRENIGWRDIPD